MSQRLPSVSGRMVLRALKRAGFFVERIRGSHHIMAHRDDPSLFAVVPVHGNRDLRTGTLRNILNQAGITVEEFLKLL